jgi:hypothetical protein
MGLAVAQIVPVNLSNTRQTLIARLVEILREAKVRQIDFALFSERALTTFLPALLDERRGSDRALFREDHAEPSSAAVLRRGAQTANRFLSGVREAKAAKLPFQHRSSGGQARRNSRQVPQDPAARTRQSQARRTVPAPGEEILRSGRWWFPGLEPEAVANRHVHLQRPTLAQNFPHAVAAKRGTCHHALQHAVVQHSLGRTSQSAHVYPSASATEQRPAECALDQYGRQLWFRGGCSLPRRSNDHRTIEQRESASRSAKNSGCMSSTSPNIAGPSIIT